MALPLQPDIRTRQAAPRFTFLGKCIRYKIVAVVKSEGKRVLNLKNMLCWGECDMAKIRCELCLVVVRGLDVDFNTFTSDDSEEFQLLGIVLE